MPFCVFVGHSVLTYANDSLTYWLPDRIKTINWLWKAFSWLGMSSSTENAQKYAGFYRFLLPIRSSQFWSMWMTFNHLKTNSIKFAHYRLKIRKVIELYDFQSLMQHPLYKTTINIDSRVCYCLCFLRLTTIHKRFLNGSITLHWCPTLKLLEFDL